MSSRLILFCTFLATSLIHAQDMTLEIRSVNTRTTTLSALEQAAKISDINPNHGSSWISSYESVEVAIKSDHETKESIGTSEKFSAEQKLLLNKASLNDEIIISVTYLPKNALNNATRNLRYSYTIVPDQQAVFPGGQEALYAYLNEKIVGPTSNPDTEGVDLAIISFSVNDAGHITDASIQHPSNNKDFDQALLGTIKDMPQWQAAVDASGVKVTQTFQLSIGYLVGC